MASQNQEPEWEVRIDPDAKPGNVLNPLARLLLSAAEKAKESGDKEVQDWLERLAKDNECTEG